ncbi:type II toxin-antitoxin system Phd/YefM family antitoxin [Komagataeibacter rhaeticus]|nr:type II toxin-antitoxin system Phd/YefM family antitoxin [Komagataeibacter rhaeticus]MDT8873474.1 type II toxin-antitoxin system Phd/YefM family antitoxin [Komagataeibacter rhaeticus]
MKAFPASAVTRNASDLLEAAAVAPVVITRHHKPRFVIMSVEHYEGPAQKAAGHRRRSGEGVIVMKDSPGTLPQKRPWQLLVVGDGEPC